MEGVILLAKTLISPILTLPSKFLISRLHPLLWHKLFPLFSTANLNLSILNTKDYNTKDYNTKDFNTYTYTNTKYIYRDIFKNKSCSLYLVSLSLITPSYSKCYITHDSSIIDNYISNPSLSLLSTMIKNKSFLLNNRTNIMSDENNILSKSLEIFNSVLYYTRQSTKEKQNFVVLDRKSTSYNEHYVNLSSENSLLSNKKLEKKSLNSLSLLYSLNSSVAIIDGEIESSVIMEE
jgi:hypothetical protein